jgi:hypothetical protein
MQRSGKCSRNRRKRELNKTGAKPGTNLQLYPFDRLRDACTVIPQRKILPLEVEVLIKSCDCGLARALIDIRPELRNLNLTQAPLGLESLPTQSHRC